MPLIASAKLLANLKDTYKSEEPLIPDIKRHILRKIEEEEATRRTDVLHPSDMSDSYWCNRHDYYGIIGTPKSPDTSSPSFAMEMIYDYGNRIHTKYQTWLAEMGVLWGLWQCLDCRTEYYAPALAQCPQCLAVDRAKYLEVPLASPTLGIEGHADGVVLGNPNRLIEIKSIGLGSLRFEAPQLANLYADGTLSIEQVWYRINRPFTKHLRQGQIYLALIRRAFPDLNIDEMVFIYEWKPNQAVKSFLVKYNPDFVAPLLDQAILVQDALRGNVAPIRPSWAEETGRQCEACDYRDTCWDREPTESKTAEAAALRVRRAAAKKRKAVLKPRPEYDVPLLPDNITEISDTELMEHLRRQVEWQNFFASEVVKLERLEGEAEQDLKYAEATAYLHIGDAYKTVTEAKAARDHNPSVMDAAALWFTAKVNRKAMQVVMESRERCAQLLSREITRRVGREPVQRRDRWSS